MILKPGRNEHMIKERRNVNLTWGTRMGKRPTESTKLASGGDHTKAQHHVLHGKSSRPIAVSTCRSFKKNGSD